MLCCVFNLSCASAFSCMLIIGNVFYSTFTNFFILVTFYVRLFNVLKFFLNVLTFMHTALEAGRRSAVFNYDAGSAELSARRSSNLAMMTMMIMMSHNAPTHQISAQSNDPWRSSCDLICPIWTLSATLDLTGSGFSHAFQQCKILKIG